jgi:hypothetical protein
MAECPYCKTPLTNLGFIESSDDLGVFIAETFRCDTCAYQLERNPVYIFGADEGEHSARQVVGGDFTIVPPADER